MISLLNTTASCLTTGKITSGLCTLIHLECIANNFSSAANNAYNAVLEIIRNCFLLILPLTITKTYLYNFDPLKPHYIVKLGFTEV